MRREGCIVVVSCFVARVQSQKLISIVNCIRRRPDTLECLQIDSVKLFDRSTVIVIVCFGLTAQ